jgi:hypothetical protein
MIAMNTVSLDAITLDPRAQPRDHLSMDIVAEYAEAMALGATFPPLVVFHDGEKYWLADGFHRHYAAKAANFVEFDCDVQKGTLRDAILYSVGANAAHGYRRTNADKRRAVMRLLDDPEWSAWSDREIARRCAVSNQFVSNLRPAPSLSTDDSEPVPRTYTTKHGTVATMNTARIGSTPRPVDPPPAWSLESIAPEARAEIDEDNSNAFIANRLWDIEAAVKGLPDPKDAARRFPSRLTHSFSAEQARMVRDWFDVFATEWDLTKGTTNVAAE